MRKHQILSISIGIFLSACSESPANLAGHPPEATKAMPIQEVHSVDTILHIPFAGAHIGEPGLFFKVGEEYHILHMAAATSKVYDKQGKFMHEMELISNQVAMSNPGNIIPWGNGIAVMDLSELKFALYNQERKFRGQVSMDFTTKGAGSILESAVINSISLDQGHILLPVQTNGEDWNRSKYFVQAQPMAIFDTSGALVRQFGKYPESYQRKEIYFSFISAHFAVSDTFIYLAFEASPEIQVYDHQGNFVKKFGEGRPEVKPGFIAENAQPSQEQYMAILDSSAFYFQIFVDPTTETLYRFIMQKAPAGIQNCRRFAREKWMQVYDAAGTLVKTCSLPKEVISIEGFSQDGSPRFVGYDLKQDSYFIYGLEWKASTMAETQ